MFYPLNYRGAWRWTIIDFIFRVDSTFSREQDFQWVLKWVPILCWESKTLASLFKRKSKSKRYPKGYVWYAKYTENGKVKKAILKTDSVQRARAKLADI